MSCSDDSIPINNDDSGRWPPKGGSRQPSRRGKRTRPQPRKRPGWRGEPVHLRDDAINVLLDLGLCFGLSLSPKNLKLDPDKGYSIPVSLAFLRSLLPPPEPSDGHLRTDTVEGRETLRIRSQEQDEAAGQPGNAIEELPPVTTVVILWPGTVAGFEL
jgi:hypothetical protein